MTSIEQNGLRIWFLDPDDAAISRYARSDPNDLRWIRAGILSGYLSLPKLKARLATTSFLDTEEETTVRNQVAAAMVWSETIKGSRVDASKADDV